MAATVNQGLVSNLTSSFPIKSSQATVEINKIKTELVCTRYQDRVFFVVTQYNKIGTLTDPNWIHGKCGTGYGNHLEKVNITRDNIVNETGDTVPIYSTNVLMGKDEPLTHVIAKNLVSKITIQKPVLLSVALKDSSPDMVRTLAQILPSLVGQ